MSQLKSLRRFLPDDSDRRKRLSSRAVTITLHALLWLSVANIAFGALMLRRPIDGVLIPSASLVLFSVSFSTKSVYHFANQYRVDSLYFTLFSIQYSHGEGGKERTPYLRQHHTTENHLTQVHGYAGFWRSCGS
jgi:hypothetical protein